MVRVNAELAEDRWISFEWGTGVEGLEDVTPVKVLKKD